MLFMFFCWGGRSFIRAFTFFLHFFLFFFCVLIKFIYICTQKHKTKHMKNSVYILFMNKDKNFKLDKKEFESYEDALIWGKLFLENFNIDMIYYY